MKTLLPILLIAIVALIGAGCEDSNSSRPEQDGDQQVYITNNLNDDIRVEYRNERDIDTVEIVTEGWLDSQERDASTIPANTTAKLTVYFNKSGMGHVTVLWGEKEHTYSIPLEIRNVSVDAGDFN